MQLTLSLARIPCVSVSPGADWWVVTCSSLQNEPFAAVFHDRFKLSTGARRIKFDQKFQLLAPGVLPIKHYSIWHRVNEE